MKLTINFEDTYDEHKDVTEELNGKAKQFDDVFNENRIIDAFASACASMMYISTVTDIPLDEVLDMWTAKMKEELNAEDTKSLLEVGKLINGLIDVMGEEN